MNRGDYNLYRGWTIPENENPNDEGYLVKYSDSYESWSPKNTFDEAYREYDETKLPFTAIGMQSADYKDRFLAEYAQVKIRLNGLTSMLEKYKEGTLGFTPTCSYELLSKQCTCMKLYMACLKERAQVEGIPLN